MKTGRPRTIAGDKSVQASFSVSLEEYAALKEQAEKCGMSLSAWLRAQVNSKTPQLVES